ncbi:hypothetical protein [Nonomuraea sp. 10N515B]|uniref:hypothetical protein n=1 Tax=Nonomuraea sp. 10N515B TaxID=3457422 RepID=UPI003FCCA834
MSKAQQKAHWKSTRQIIAVSAAALAALLALATPAQASTFTLYYDKPAAAGGTYGGTAGFVDRYQSSGGTDNNEVFVHDHRDGYGVLITTSSRRADGTWTVRNSRYVNDGTSRSWNVSLLDGPARFHICIYVQGGDQSYCFDRYFTNG